MRETTRQELQNYLDHMDRLTVSSIYTPDFRDGFRHALAMLDAYESDPGPEDVVPLPVQEAARLMLSRRRGQTDA